ncbi:hemicentin-1-like isoform X2 [Mya arenaria]|uniref:hemicentin-1-like isoform X2 n=1 Tax=Mya arenaria TaxID=6604 RepID=UPI0022E36B70|nr:hemicentin-1-like isoform X2 [Mya arenaria]
MCVENHTCGCIMELIILFGIILCSQVLSITLSGNGTSGGFTVQENALLELTCSTSTDVQYVVFNRRIREFAYHTITSVGYGSSGCAVSDPEPISYLSCSCVSRHQFACVIRNVTRNMNGHVWFCLPPGGNANVVTGDKTIVVTIGINAVSIVFPAVQTVIVIENSARQFRLETSAGNPQATVEWYKDNGTPSRADDTEITTGKETDSSASGTLIVTIGKLTLTVQRNDHDVGVYCRANNGGAWLYSSSVVLDVQYEPLVPKVSYKRSEVTTVRVISGRSMTLTCSSIGNPSPTYTWTYPGVGSYTGPTLTLSSVQTTHAGDVTCAAMNTLSPTGGTAVEKSQHTNINLMVLYPPSTPSCSISGTSISTTAILVEGTDRFISCTSYANPPLVTYIWSTPSRGQVSGANVFLTNVEHPADHGQYTLSVTNTMDPTGENTETGTNSRAFSVDVQFGPKVQLPQTYTVLEGRVVNYSCSIIPGNPSQTSFMWTRSIDSRKWNSQIFSISSVQKQDDGMYACTATNRLTPTGFPAHPGNHSGTMHLNVQYKSSVTEFRVTGIRHEANVTQAEKKSTTFTCMVDSNPPSTINIRKDGELRRSVNHATQLEYTIANLACTDAGLYTCDSSNQFNFDKSSAKDLHLFVTCSPRRPPGQDIKLNFTAQLHDNATLQYNVVAYPVPIASQFVWKRCLRRNMCIQLSNIAAKYEITTMYLSSKLTVFDADIDDFGAYSLSIKNGIGEEIVEDMFLQSVGPPDTPTCFMVISNTVTSSSAVLSWIPGPNNGSPQTFHISYRVLDALGDWPNFSFQDNGETEMNVTLHSLAPGRSYFVKCYALNTAGDSGKQILRFSTLKEVAPIESRGAVIAGVVITGFITMVVIVVVFCFLRNKYSCAFKVTRKEDSRSRPTVPFAEIPGDNDAITYETVSAKNNTPVYDVLSVGNEGPDKPHVYMPLDESMATPDPNKEESKTKVPIYHNTMAKNQVQTVL